MALVKCSKCSAQISDLTSTCPKCGAPAAKQTHTIAIKKRANTFSTILILLLIAGIIGAIFKTYNKSVQVLSPEQIAALKKDSARDTIAIAATKLIRQNLENPSSAKFEEIRANDDGSIVCIKIRAKDNAGAYDSDQISVIKGTLKFSEKTWNKNCMQALPNITDKVAPWSDY